MRKDPLKLPGWSFITKRLDSQEQLHQNSNDVVALEDLSVTIKSVEKSLSVIPGLVSYCLNQIIEKALSSNSNH